MFQLYYGGRPPYEGHESRKDKRGAKWADAYMWYCPVSTQQLLIDELLPHLRLKADQARVIQEFLLTKHSFKREKWGKGSAPLSTDEIRHRDGLRMRIHLLNKKGPDSRSLLLDDTVQGF